MLTFQHGLKVAYKTSAISIIIKGDSYLIIEKVEKENSIRELWELATNWLVVTPCKKSFNISVLLTTLT
jgi:hypothetical protein